MRPIERLMADLRRAKVRVWAEGERLRYQAPRGALTPDLLAELQNSKAELLEFCQRAKAGTNPFPLEPSPRDVDIPISLAQHRLWLLDQLEGPGPTYNIALALRLRGTLDGDAVERSLTDLMRRHESLRTSFQAWGETVRQVIAPAPALPFALVDLRHLDASQRPSEACHQAREEALRPFDLSRGPLVRFVLWRLDDRDHVFLVCMHHIISDGRSIEILTEDMAGLYASYRDGTGATLPALPIQYGDFAWHQRRWLTDAVLQAQLDYWKRQLAGMPPLLELPTDRPRPPALTSAGATLRSRLEAGLVGKLRQVAQRSSATLYTVLLAGLASVLARHTGREEIPIGCPVTHRDRPELDRLIGFFINTLVLRLDLSGNPSFRELLARARATLRDGLANQDVPFDKVAETVVSERNSSYSPLVQVSMMMLDSAKGRPHFPGLETEPFDFDRPVARYDVTLEVYESKEEVDIFWIYNTDLFEADTVARMARHLENLLESAADDPDETWNELSMLDEGEVRSLLQTWNDTRVDASHDQGVHQLFERQAERTPHAPALEWQGKRLTYAELNSRSNQLAHHLAALGVGPEVLVGVCVERSFAMLVSLLAVLKAGGAYVPLDPTYPRERLGFMLRDSRARILLAPTRLLEHFPGHETRVIGLDSVEALVSGESTANPVRAISGKNLAYMIYTSGSTGRPKGAMIPHRALANHMRWMQHTFAITPADRVLQKTPFSFDASVWEFYLPLLTGGTLVLAGPDDHRDVEALVAAIRRQRVTILQGVPSLLRILVEVDGLREADSLRYVFSGGEPLTAELRDRFFAVTGAAVCNLYGPTEACIDTTFYVCPRDEEGSADRSAVPIGRPIWNATAYVLDEHRQPVPVGVAGELYLGGIPLGRGYLNQPELTAEKFIPDPFGGEAGGRLYRTGDLARWLPDGNLECLGRSDLQVKIRGHRIEPGEIEAQLVSRNPIREAVVVARGREELVAYVTTAGHCALDVEDVRDDLRARLPEYMVPAHFVHLERLPLNPNGKVDRSGLPAPVDDLGRAGAARSAGRETTALAPGDETENRLAKIWREVLQIETFGVCDNFFKLGGHSLKAMQVVARVQKEFGVKVSLQSFFRTPTIRALRGLVGEGGAIDGSRIEPAPPQPHYALSHAQRRLWLLHHMRGETAYNIPRAFLFEGSLDIPALRSAFASLIDRHEALRTAFILVDGEPRQSIHRHLELALREVDLSGHEDADQRAQEIVGQESSTPFELANPPLLRMTVIKLAEERYVLVFVMHHIIGDGWSMTVLYPEVLALYEAFRRGLPNPLEPLRIQYKDFSEWQNKRSFERDEQYWLAKLAGVPERIRFTYDFPPEDERDFRGDSLTHWLDAETTRGLRELAKSHGTTTSTVVLALFKLFLFQLTKQDDLCIGVSIANRNRLELENLIGFFVNILPVRTRFSEEMEFESLLEQVAQNALEALEHQDYPFDMLVEKINPSRESNRQPLVNVIYGFQNYEDVKPGTNGTAGPDPEADIEAGA